MSDSWWGRCDECGYLIDTPNHVLGCCQQEPLVIVRHGALADGPDTLDGTPVGPESDTG